MNSGWASIVIPLRGFPCCFVERKQPPVRMLNLLLFVTGNMIAASSAGACTRPVVELGIDSAGQANPRWIDAVRGRVDAQTLAQMLRVIVHHIR